MDNYDWRANSTRLYPVMHHCCPHYYHNKSIPDIEPIVDYFYHHAPRPLTPEEWKQVERDNYFQLFAKMSRDDALKMINQRIREHNKPVGTSKSVSNVILNKMTIAFEKVFHPDIYRKHPLPPQYDN